MVRQNEWRSSRPNEGLRDTWDGSFRNGYAEGGAREARFGAKESNGEAIAGGAACLAACCVSGNKETGAAARAGMCRAWQTGQTLSGPPVCW
jgi:hypothetical protein